MQIQCEYECEVHDSQIEFHHPISSRPMVGLNLCQLHHSLLYGRKRRDPREIILNKTIKEMRAEVKQLETEAVIRQGCLTEEIDKR